MKSYLLKTHICPEFLLLCAALVLLVASAPPAPAQTYSVLYTFTGGADGGNPESPVILDAQGNLYSTTNFGGLTGGACGHVGCGTVFELTAGGIEDVLFRFNYFPNHSHPFGGLVMDAEGNFYGTTYDGGNITASCKNGCGTVYELTPAGVMTVLYKFSDFPDGAHPYGSLVRDEQGNLYGTTQRGGINKVGTLFKVGSDGTETIVCSLKGAAHSPVTGLVRDLNGNFFGTTPGGGHSWGTVFEVTAGGVERVLHKFTGGADGGWPRAELLIDADGNLYGTTINGGAYGFGTVFEVNAAGVETVLHNFTAGPDGAAPRASLIIDAEGNLYGTAFNGNSPYGAGSIFKLTPAGTFTVLYNFTGGANGGNPMGALALDTQGNLYGTTYGGGAFGPYCDNQSCGVVFKLAP